jgi:GT2 family glycosyltransferase
MFIKRVPNNDWIYETCAGAYGGMFFDKKIIHNIGLPKDKMFLYFDDIEYTYRAYSKGVRLFLVPGAKITDQDFSYTNKNFFMDTEIKLRSSTIV